MDAQSSANASFPPTNFSAGRGFGVTPSERASSSLISFNRSTRTSVTVYDDVNYVQPYPDYEIKWQTPTAVNVYVKVELADNNFMPSDISVRVQSAVLAAFNGEDGGTRARIGSTIYAGRYYAGVTAIDPENVDIYGITLSRDGTTFSTSLSFGIDEVPTLDTSNITVTLT